LVGDHRQFPEIEAGGVYHGLSTAALTSKPLASSAIEM
jgi:hypothetical protein